MKLLLLLFFIINGLATFGQNHVQQTYQPTLEDYEAGETWSWRYKGVTASGEVRSEGIDTRKIINQNGDLMILIGKDTVLVEDLVKPSESKTPRYDWPLEVGKKWKFEENWTSQDGTSGQQSQDAEIISFNLYGLYYSI